MYNNSKEINSNTLFIHFHLTLFLFEIYLRFSYMSYRHTNPQCHWRTAFTSITLFFFCIWITIVLVNYMYSNGDGNVLFRFALNKTKRGLYYTGCCIICTLNKWWRHSSCTLLFVFVLSCGSVHAKSFLDCWCIETNRTLIMKLIITFFLIYLKLDTEEPAMKMKLKMKGNCAWANIQHVSSTQVFYSFPWYAVFWKFHSVP